MNMEQKFNRRQFVKMSSAAAGGLAISQLGIAQTYLNEDKPLRMGFVGVGDRGSYHLDSALGIEGVIVPAVCDIKDGPLHRAKRWVEEAGQPSPALYGKSETDFVRMCETEDLDVIICSTSWK